MLFWVETNNSRRNAMLAALFLPLGKNGFDDSGTKQYEPYHLPFTSMPVHVDTDNEIK